MTERMKPRVGGPGRSGRARPVRRVLVMVVAAYCCAWLACFGLLKNAQRGWGLLYADQENAIIAASSMSKLPHDLFIGDTVDPRPKDAAPPISSTPPDTAGPFIWDLIATRRQVLEQKREAEDDIDVQTTYTAGMLDRLKANRD